MTNDIQSARDALRLEMLNAVWLSNDADTAAAVTDAVEVCATIAAIRSIHIAAKLLRNAGWTVEEPNCEACKGVGRIRAFCCTDCYHVMDCPTCKGTGKRDNSHAR